MKVITPLQKDLLNIFPDVTESEIMRFNFKSSFDRCLKKLPAQKQVLIFEAIEKLKPHQAVCGKVAAAHVHHNPSLEDLSAGA